MDHVKPFANNPVDDLPIFTSPPCTIQVLVETYGE